MLPIMRVAVLVSIVYLGFAAFGKNTSTAALASLGDEIVAACTTDAHEQVLASAVSAVDYAGAVLIANGEAYASSSVDEIERLIADLPAFDMSDGLSTPELATLDRALELGRQHSYAVATATLEGLLAEMPTAVRVASADRAIDFAVLENLSEGC